MKRWALLLLLAGCAGSARRDEKPRARPLLALTPGPKAPEHCRGRHCVFFRNLKYAVGAVWNPADEMRRHDPSGLLYRQTSRTTTLKVTLEQDGTLQDIAVVRSSGLDFLDAEAMSAFRRAQPFEPPPAELIGADGRMTFDFGCTLDFKNDEPSIARAWSRGENEIKKLEADLDGFLRRFYGRAMKHARTEMAKLDSKRMHAGKLLQMRFTVRIDGVVEDATVLQSSGSPTFDELMVRLMLAAGSAEAPPDILFDENGHFVGLLSFRHESASDLTFPESAEAFLRRVERRIGEHWPPKHIVDAHRPLLTSRRHFVIAHLVLDRYGALISTGITVSSGKDDIDTTALEAIRKAAPFDNPPPTLAWPDGYVHFEHELFL